MNDKEINTSFSDLASMMHIFEIAIIGSQDGFKKESDYIINNQTLTLKKYIEDIKSSYIKIELNPSQIKSLNFIELDEIFNQDSIIVKRLLYIAQHYKDNSEAFKNFYNSLDELYTTLSTIFIEIGFLESEYNQSLRELNAS